jgi:hypothetical protein
MIPAQNVPDWMIVFAFIASLILTILKGLEIVFGASRKANLEIVLTRDLFFRIREAGESLYVNAVLVAYDVGALIKDIQAALIKENGSMKHFTLKVAQVGEKYRTPDGVYQLSFHSTSPLAFIPENNPLRLVYACEHESYAEATRQEFYNLRIRLIVIREKYPNPSTLDENQSQEFVAELSREVEAARTNIMDKVQIEPGKYTLTISMAYRQKGKFIPAFRIKQAQARIQFVVEEGVRELLRDALYRYLMQKSIAFLMNQEGVSIQTPDYVPARVTEL